MPELRKISERLRWLRSQTNLTQEEFGQRCGVSKGYISRLEAEKRANPSDDFLRRCSDAFRIPLEWLERGQGDLPIVSPSGQGSPDGQPAASPAAPAPSPGESDQEMFTELLRLFLEAVSMESDELLRLTGLVLDSQKLSATAKARTVMAANLAFKERDGQRRAKS